jgi:hypothetical protein
MGRRRVGPHAIREYLGRMRERYELAERTAKGRLLDEVCEMTGYHRKAVIRLLRRPPRPWRRRRGGPHVRYGPEVVAVLRAIWTAAGYPWSVRLKALLPLWLPWARRHLRLTDALEVQVRRISPRQIDRCLRADKRTLRRRQYGRTKPGTLLKHAIPLRTDRWDVQEPGFTEIDLVAHSGDRADGEFLHSLNVTDIHTTWVETRAVLGKSQDRVRAALDAIRRTLPFRLRGIDSDNGSEFINDHLRRYCGRRRIQFTRGRPYKKDDNAHIEQKNWTHVRKVLGYDRYDSEPALMAINAVYADLRLLQNVFLPTVKLVTKERVGARVRRRYDRPQTPLERVRQSISMHKTRVAALVAVQKTLDPFVLAQRIDQALTVIYQLANHRRASARVDAARPADAQHASTRSLENPRAGFPQRPHASLFSTVQNPVTRVVAR